MNFSFLCILNMILDDIFYYFMDNMYLCILICLHFLLIFIPLCIFMFPLRGTLFVNDYHSSFFKAPLGENDFDFCSL